MNIRSFATVLRKASSIAISLVMVVGVFAGVLPQIAQAAAPSYHVAVTSTTFGALSITLSGTESASNYAGQLSSYHVYIDWGDTHSTDLTSLGLTDSNGNFSGSWGSASHTYTATGAETITVKLCHAQCSGNEGADSTVTLNVVIPPAVLTVIKHVDNTAGGSASASSFTMNVANTGGTSFTAMSGTGSETGSTFSLPDGASYSVTESGGPSGYTESTSGACSGTAHTGDNLTCTVTNTFGVVNHAPVANNRTITTNEDTATSSTLVATDADNNSLTYSIVGSPSHGTISGFDASTGAFTYTPNSGYAGSDSFTFKANDGAAESNVATVSVTVTAVNHAPVATDASVTTAEDTPIAITLPATDSDGDTLTYSTTTSPTHGILGTIVGNVVTYTPDANFNGSDAFSFMASDGTLDSNIATISISVTAVNDAPVALDDSYGTSEDTPLTVAAASGVLANDSDVDGDSLTAALVSGPSHGTLTLSADGSFTYTPEADYSGSDTFTYKASDGSLESNSATVTINVGSADETPTGVADSYSTDENTALTQAAPGVLSNDTGDSDGDMSAALVSGPAHGTLTLNADGSFTYTPATDYFGPDSFVYTANDGANASSDTTVTIRVNEVHVAQADLSITKEVSTTTPTEGSTVVYTITVTNNSSDDAQNVSVSDTWPQNGLTFVSASSSVGSYNAETSSWTIGTLAANTNAVLQITASVDPESAGSSIDNSATVSSDTNDPNVDNNKASAPTVSPVAAAQNTAPVASDGTLTTNENAAGSGTLSASDADGDTLTYATSSNPSEGTITAFDPATGAFTYTPNSNYTGSDSFTFKANDGSLDSNTATVTISVNATGGSPSPTPSPAPSPTPPPGGNGPIVPQGGNGPIVAPQGQVLGASTSTLPELPAGCSALLSTYMRKGKKNDAGEVRKLQQFLNDQLGANIPVTGFFGPMTDTWVRAFQQAHRDQVLTPWKLSAPTGFVYLTTQRWINLTYCSSLSIPLPTLVPYTGE